MLAVVLQHIATHPQLRQTCRFKPLWHLQESMGLRAAIEGNAQGSITSQHFEELCSRLLTQMELEEYVFSYMQAHT